MKNNNATVQPTVAASETSARPVARKFPAPPGQPASAATHTRTIKRFVRHRVTRLYFSETGWTSDPLRATVFADSLEAAQTCARRGLSEVELALHLGAGALDFFSTPLR